MRIATLLKGLGTAALVMMAGLVVADPDPITDRSKIVDGVDWKKVETVTVEIDEHSYSPNTIAFKAGQPYKLVLKNVGEKAHYFTAPEFYKAIATRKVQANKDGEIKADYFLALELMAKGGQLDLYFVPVKKGKYPVYCTIEDHRKEGMEGGLTIE